MKKSWRTVLEGQTESANEQIKQILQKEQAPRKKALAIFLAVVGIALIGVGITPLLTNNSDENLKASIVEEEPALTGTLSADKFLNTDNKETNKPTEATVENDANHAVAEDDFIASATTVNNVDEVNIQINQNSNESNILTPDEPLSLEENNPPVTENVATDQVSVSTETATEDSPFKVNTHTGTVDNSNSAPKTINTYSQTSKSTNSVVSSTTKQATKTAETGPAQTGLLALISVIIAYFFKRKRAL